MTDLTPHGYASNANHSHQSAVQRRDAAIAEAVAAERARLAPLIDGADIVAEYLGSLGTAESVSMMSILRYGLAVALREPDR